MGGQRTIRHMHISIPFRIRRQFALAFDTIEGLRTTPNQRRLTPVRQAASAAGSRPTRRPIRPVRPWERMVRI
jgi:hypothetical protein